MLRQGRGAAPTCGGAKRQLSARGLPLPTLTPGLNLNLNYGRLRDALLSKLVRDGGLFASHDPDGHLIVFSNSQSAGPRQQRGVNRKELEP